MDFIKVKAHCCKYCLEYISNKKSLCFRVFRMLKMLEIPSEIYMLKCLDICNYCNKYFEKLLLLSRNEVMCYEYVIRI